MPITYLILLRAANLASQGGVKSPRRIFDEGESLVIAPAKIVIDSS
jgi:hypothetical protein